MALKHITAYIPAAFGNSKPPEPVCRECGSSFVRLHPEQTFCKSCLIELGKVALERHDELEECLQ